MKRVIFTTYDDIEKEQDQWGTNHYATESIKTYFDKLIANKEEYANSLINVEFKFYHNTMKDFNIDADLEFTKTNLYKHHIMAELADDYDEVMYVDMDVVFNTEKNVFDELDLSEGIHIQVQTDEVTNKDIEGVMFENIGSRSPTLKYHITKDLLGGGDNHVMNTGIMIAKSEHIKQIKFMERLPSIIEKVDDLKRNGISDDQYKFLRMYYYPNNESIFSYIMESEDIPYVIMENRWHTLVGKDPSDLDWDNIEIAHFISKKFNMFFKDKTKLIYSIYIEIPDERLDNPRGPNDDPVNKSKRTQERLAEYKDSLYDNHLEYAHNHEATYIHFTRDNRYEEFRARFPDLSEYDVINLYKVHLLDYMTHLYDLVLYVDFDVVFVSDHDVFDYLRGEHLFCCYATNAKDAGVNLWDARYLKAYDKDFRSPEAKYWNSHAMLSEQDVDPDNYVFNTGIMMASREVMEKLGYFSDISETIAMMKELKEVSIYPPQVQASFGYDNETIMSYKVKMNNVPVQRLSDTWHFKHVEQPLAAYTKGTEEYKTSKYTLNAEITKHNSVMVHMISKNFGLLLDS
tara:strand:+ start:4507 stop:6222 length:1716 start_codon:yes stop_codon:yes gene_type:complete